ncbi:unnamed protein product [Echinostoma caproni]|uniref:Uncharacterized protein n=1 Tax=Echinostoma caproni TaxID=27848 RepID=A0A3P8HXK8_9TREM|nr:unnamed protein product [Echinostoma caproni]
MPNYFGYPTNAVSGVALNKSSQIEFGSTQNGMSSRWTAPKPTQTAFRPSAYPNTSSYMYDQGSGNLSFESTDFSTILGSTDQALVRSRASGLIEQLLCSDHPMGSMLGNGKPAPPVSSSQSAAAAAAYLPNAFVASNPLVSSMSTTNGAHPMSVDTGHSFSHDSLMLHSSAVDLRPHAGSLLSDGSNDNRTGHIQHALTHQQLQQQHHHHLRPVSMQGCSAGTDIMTGSVFSASWNPYLPQFHLPSSTGHGTTMSETGHNMSYSAFNGNGSFHPLSDSQQLSVTKAKYESIESMASSNHNGSSQHQRLPFLSGPHSVSDSSPTSSANGASVTTWRHSLGIDSTQHTDPHRLGSLPPTSSGPLTPLPPAGSPGSVQSTNTGHESRSLGPPVTPPSSLYYSPMRQSLSSMYGSSECALDTPPYQQQQQTSQSLKSEPLDLMDTSGSITASVVAVATTVASSAGTTDYDTSSQTSSATRHSAYTASCGGGGVSLRTRSDADADSEMSARFADAYSYDDDCEPLELELSLELADRIVGSTRSNSKP